MLNYSKCKKMEYVSYSITIIDEYVYKPDHTSKME